MSTMLLRRTCLSLALVLSLAATALAETPSVHFDLVPLVACRDVTTFEFSQTNPGEKLVEARFTVSALLRRGSAADIADYQFTFSSPERNLAIADFSPKTSLATDVAGTIHTENNEQSSKSAGLNLNLKYDGIAAAGATAGGERKEGSSVKFDRLPPLDVVSAAGTFDRGRGLYVKLRPSPRTSLEGTHEFRLTFQVPQAWRGDYLQVRCVASGLKRGSKPSTERVSAGNVTFVVGLYEQPDFSARAAAQRLVDSEQDLRGLAASRKKEIEKAAYSSNQATKLAIMLDLSQPRVPENWLGVVLYNGVGNDTPSYAKHLPSDVTAALAKFTTAKLELHRMAR